MHLIQLGFALFLLLALGCATETSPGLEVSDRIWKGVHADIAMYPYQVALYIIPTKNGELFGGGTCGGSIISTNFILTAAHCLIPYDVTYDPITPDHITVYANRSILYEPNHGAEISNVEKIFFHPLANNTGTLAAGHMQGCMDNDVAILKLTKPLTFGPGIQVIPLAKADTKVRANAVADISGYGYLTGRQERSNQIGQLYAAKIRMADDAICENCYGGTHGLNNIICGGATNHDSATLSGDSGGPLVVDGVLEGITVCGFAPPYSMNCPDAYARVADSSTRAFIKEITGV